MALDPLLRPMSQLTITSAETIAEPTPTAKNPISEALEKVLVELPAEINRLITEYAISKVKIFVKNQATLKSITIEMLLTEKGCDLKQKIFTELKIPLQKQSLLYKGTMMSENTKMLQEYDIQTNDIVFITGTMRG